MAGQTAVQQAKEVAGAATSGPQIKQIIRSISSYSNPLMNVYLVDEVNSYIASMQGWRLNSVHYLETTKMGDNPASVYTFAYILEASE